MLSTTVAAARSCHTFDGSSGSERRSGRTSPTSATARTFASGVYELNHENLIDWVYDAPSMIPMESAGLPTASRTPDVTCVGHAVVHREHAARATPSMTRAAGRDRSPTTCWSADSERSTGAHR